MPTTASEAEANSPAYRLDGTRVTPSQMRPRELYIQGGRKTINK